MTVFWRGMLQLFAILYIGTACVLMPFTIWKFDWQLGVMAALGAAVVIVPILIVVMLLRTKWH